MQSFNLVEGSKYVDPKAVARDVIVQARYEEKRATENNRSRMMKQVRDELGQENEELREKEKKRQKELSKHPRPTSRRSSSNSPFQLKKVRVVKQLNNLGGS